MYISPILLDHRAETFPVLTGAQIERIRPLGHIRQVQPGEILFEPGDRAVPFFVLLSGSLDIVQPTFEGERPVVQHAPGEFTGEIATLSAQDSLVRGRVLEGGEFLEVSDEGLRSLIAKDAELSEILLRAFILRRIELIRRGWGNVVVLGSQHSAKTLQIREFLNRNGHPYAYLDLDRDRPSQALLDRFEIQPSQVPVVICCGRGALRSPSIQELANLLDLNPTIEGKELRDVIIVGAGPAGLAAAVYAASEGLDVLLVETEAPGGQAGTSSKIENYLGFPTGISGQELAARALTQARKFGAQIIIARSVMRLECDRQPYRVVLDTGEMLETRCIVIATGARYNRPELAGLARFEGEGVYYGATHMEAQLCEAEEVAVVGGGNSAGQAAVYLSQTARKVHMLIRKDDLSSTMSRYLIQRLQENPAVDIHFHTEVAGIEGDEHLERITWRDRATGGVGVHLIRHLFVMTGASPGTEWLRGCLALDEKGFILTGRDLDGVPGATWPLERAPQMLETSRPGVFAVGDVRAGNVKRVAAAVGEGAISIYMVHRAIAEL
jgi:thioredoxin reductase (NADPH)